MKPNREKLSSLLDLCHRPFAKSGVPLNGVV